MVCTSTLPAHGKTPGLPWVRTGKPAAATAAGLDGVWSTIRLLIMRGCESVTDPVVWAYDVLGPPGAAKMLGSAVLKSALANRGKVWSAAPNFS
jgi:hypothetical protein